MKKSFVILFSFSLFLMGCGDRQESEIDESKKVELKETIVEAAAHNKDVIYTSIRSVDSSMLLNVYDLQVQIGDANRSFLTPPETQIISGAKICKFGVNLPFNTEIDSINLVHVTQNNRTALYFDVILVTKNVSSPTKLKFFEIPIIGSEFNNCFTTVVVVKDAAGKTLEKQKVRPEYLNGTLPNSTNNGHSEVSLVNYAFHPALNFNHIAYQIFADLPDSNSFENSPNGQAAKANILIDIPKGYRINQVFKQFDSINNDCLVIDIVLISESKHNIDTLQSAVFDISWDEFQQANDYIVTVNKANGGKKRKVIQAKTRPDPEMRN